MVLHFVTPSWTFHYRFHIAATGFIIAEKDDVELIQQ
jgi:hypothetical protein